MAASYAFLSPSVPSSTLNNRISPSLSLNGSGFCSYLGISKRVFCSSIEGAEKHAAAGVSSTESRASRLINRGCKLVGCGSAVPKLQISNDDLSKIVETSDEWISTRTGIRNRHVLSVTFISLLSVAVMALSFGSDLLLCEDSLVGLATEAARNALQMANVEPDDIDLVLMCTSTPEDLFGSAPQIQRALGCTRSPLSYDITAACSGFLMGLVSAACHACNSEEDGMFAFDLHSDGDGARHLNLSLGHDKIDAAIGSNGAVTGFPPRRQSYSCINMNGKEVFRFAVKCVPQSIEAALQKAGLNGSNIDWLLLHQANQRIIDAVATRLKVPPEQVLSNLANYGNTSAASIPLALDEAVRSGKVQPGHIIAASGFGAGLTWGSSIIRWG
uniref:Beta-ketoacyl-[acyl-carrier-protein] synthase III C-terminal domain-containing protein n=1 Tax=Chenopodium quinoa TaxID=63459 RepID=A0A803L6J1_CHEQI